MPETPRTWTLEGDLVGVPHEPITRVSDGYVDISEGPIEVVEKAPVDAERERLLDLLERTLRVSLEGARWVDGHRIFAEIEDRLIEYGRLGKEES